MENILFDYRLQGDSIDVSKIDKARRPVEILTLKVTEDGKDEKTNTEFNVTTTEKANSWIEMYFTSVAYSADGRQVICGIGDHNNPRGPGTVKVLPLNAPDEKSGIKLALKVRSGCAAGVPTTKGCTPLGPEIPPAVAVTESPKLAPLVPAGTGARRTEKLRDSPATRSTI